MISRKLSRRRALGLGAGVLSVGYVSARYTGWYVPGDHRPRFNCTPTTSVPGTEEQIGMRFFAVGDTGQSTPLREACLKNMAATHAKLPHTLLTMLGDNIYPDGAQSEFDPAWTEHFVNAYGALGLPAFACLGNHDHQGSVEGQIAYSKLNPLWRLPATYYSTLQSFAEDCSAEFFFLDTQPLRTSTGGPFFPTEQIQWLEKALGQSTADWKIVCGHHPLRSYGHKGGGRKLRGLLEPIFLETGVDLYLSGHSHTLEAINPGYGFVQVVSGASSTTDEFTVGADTAASLAGGGFASIALGKSSLWVNLVPPTPGAQSPGVRLDRLESKGPKGSAGESISASHRARLQQGV